MGKEFNRIYDNNKNAVYSYLYYMTKTTEDAEDLCQETFFKIYRNLKSYRGECSERSWCITIARNTFLSWVRKRKVAEELNNEMEQLPSGSGSNPELRMLRLEEREIIKKVLLQLKEEYRTILLLRDYEQLSYNEIQEVTGLSESAVKVRIYRARGKYKKMYTAYVEGGDNYVM